MLAPNGPVQVGMGLVCLLLGSSAASMTFMLLPSASLLAHPKNLLIFTV